MTLPRRLSLARVVVFLSLFAGLTASVRAQGTARSNSPAQGLSSIAPRKFWGALSLGNATASIACSICRDISDRSVAAGLTLGVRQTRRTYFGVQLDGWYHFKAGENDRVYAIGPMVQYYLGTRRPFFARLGMSWATYLATDEDESLSSRSVAAHIGLGYDFVVSRSYLLTPFASYMRGGGGRLSLNGERASIPTGVEMVQYGLQVSLR